MKFHLLFIYCFGALLLLSCDKEKSDKDLNGLVSFAEDPSYSDGTISFAASVQFGFVGEAVKCEYQILDGSSIIEDGEVNCNNNGDGMGLFWESNIESVNINAGVYSGKTIVIFLDPSNKITSSDYRSEQYVNLYKKKSVTFP